MYQYHISFIGAGRVASALCRAMSDAGYTIDLIVSETDSNCKSLAEKYNASSSSNADFPDSTDLIIVAVPDHSLKDVLSGIKCNRNTTVVHTAGSFGTEVFPEGILNHGVFYPLQTFSEGREIMFSNIPILIESPSEKNLEILKNIAGSLSSRVYEVDHERRRILHVAAVIVNNFTNHLLVLGENVAGEAGFSFDILAPLVIETYMKAIENGPQNSQTGPAVRNDKNTIEKHLELLSFSPEIRRIYSEMTRSITDYYKMNSNG